MFPSLEFPFFYREQQTKAEAKTNWKKKMASQQAGQEIPQTNAQTACQPQPVIRT